MKQMKEFPLRVAPDVQRAIAAAQPVLALESTVLTHGLPYPRNLETLYHLEQCCRERGVEPATVIVLDGEFLIGMQASDIDKLQYKMTSGEQVLKLGRRDLSLAYASHHSGGTTVSATMYLAWMAGIPVFATGGIGGVHRNWENTLDISNDLITLSEVPVIVVSAGCKAILDIPATLEYLETLGVPVLGWQTQDFPAFYTRRSGNAISHVDSTAQIKAVYEYQVHLESHPKGILIANPIPREAEISSEIMETYISQALKNAEAKGVKGKSTTPFLLSALAETTSGASVTANLALLENNVKLGADIAKELI